MKKTVTIALLFIVVFGGLLLAMKARAPQAPPPTTQEIWADAGIPVETDAVILGDMEQTVEVTGDINALNSVTISAKIPGRIASVYAREGDTVSKGMTIVTLDQEDAISNLQQAQAGLESASIRLSQAKTNATVTRIQTDTAIEQAEASLKAAKAKLAVVKNPARSQERIVSENNVASAKANLDNAESNYKRYKQLVDEGAVSQVTFDVYKTQYAVALSEYKSTKERLSLIKEGGRSEDVLAAQSQVDVAREQLRSARANSSQNLLKREDIKSALASVRQSQATLAMAKQQLANTYIKSPISGTIATRTTEPGQVVTPGQALASVVNLGSVYFKGDVSEKELVNVNKGQQVLVSIDAIPGKTFTGKVSEIYPSGSTLSRNFSVRIAIVGENNEIRPAMFARGNIVVGTSRNVLLVPKDAIEERKGSTVVFTAEPKIVKTPGKKLGVNAKTEQTYIAKRHDVSIVRENREYVEIRTPTDLEAGDIVITQGRQNLQNGTKVLLPK